MFDLLTEVQLNEIFDADTPGIVYPVENLTPNAKVPQMLHMKVPGTNDLIIRLTHLDTIGTRVKAVQPNDKTVQVFLMSLSDKGNITDFRGGLGTDPVGAINTMFATVMDISKKYHFESVLFRFTRTKMKGKSEQAKRVLSRLIKQRSGGRYTTLEEVTRSESKKFDFALAIKKNSDLLDDIASSAKGYQKVETKAGITYINDNTGNQVTKAEVVADVLTSQSAKITDQQIAAKSKISRRAAFDAMYNVGTEFSAKRNEANETTFQELKNTVPITPATRPESIVFRHIANKIKYKSYADSLRNWNPKEVKYGPGNLNAETFLSMMKDVFKTTPANTFKLFQEHVDAFADIVEQTDPRDTNATVVKIANYFSSGRFAELDFDDRQTLIKGAVYTFIHYISNDIREAYSDYTIGEISAETKYTDEDIKAIQSYTGNRYVEMNDFLTGSRPNISPATLAEIKTLDNIFVNKGDTLPKGTKVYRGMSMKVPQLKTVVESKIMYFANIVSTSLLPVIYNGAFAAVHPTIDNASTDITNLDTIEDVLGSKLYTPDDAYDYKRHGEIGKTISLGMVISGVDKINCIVPGNVSSYSHECEVMLPRGTAMRIIKFMAPPEDSDGWAATGLMYLDIIAPDQLTESMEFIDGDKFLAEGVLEPISFSNMFNTRHKILTESLTPDNEMAKDLLLSCINMNQVPDRFMR
jgi:hypothetical protein